MRANPSFLIHHIGLGGKSLVGPPLPRNPWSLSFFNAPQQARSQQQAEKSAHQIQVIILQSINLVLDVNYSARPQDVTLGDSQHIQHANIAPRRNILRKKDKLGRYTAPPPHLSSCRRCAGYMLQPDTCILPLSCGSWRHYTRPVI